MKLNDRKFLAKLLLGTLQTSIRATFVACNQILMAVLLLGAFLAVIVVATHSTRPDRVTGALESSEAEEAVSGSQSTRPKSKLVRILVPGPIVELSESKSRSSLVRRYDETRALLEERGYKDLWYALVYRTISENGRVEELPYFRQPAQDPMNFREFQFVVEQITKKREVASQENDNEVTLSVIPEDLEHADPRMVMAEALDTAPTLDRWRNDRNVSGARPATR